METPWWLSSIIWLAKRLRPLPGVKQTFRIVRHRSSLALVRSLHLAILHRVRRLGPAVTAWSTDEAADIAMQICTESRRLLAVALEVDPNQLHACLKMMVDCDGAEKKVATWARSEPFDDRPSERGENNAHSIETNTVWAALLGRRDESRSWRPFDSFCCNDLTKRADFHCDRVNWRRYYRSTFVFPIRFVSQKDPTSAEVMGFLAFDSPKVNTFAGLPDIFDYADGPTEYRDQLEASTWFHLGGIIVDTLGAVLRQAYSKRQSREATHGDAT